MGPPGRGGLGGFGGSSPRAAERGVVPPGQHSYPPVRTVIPVAGVTAARTDTSCGSAGT